jgi:hypothetical protein
MSHFQFGNGWFPVHKSQVVYKGQGLFHVECETSWDICEVRVKPEKVEAVKQYLTEVLVEGEETDWVPESWDPEPKADAKAAEPALAPAPARALLPVGTRVCTHEDQGWFFGRIGGIEQDRKVYRVSYTNWEPRRYNFESKDIIPCNLDEASLLPDREFLVFGRTHHGPMPVKTVKRLILDECVLCTDNSYVPLSDIQAVLPVE